jgi:diguanylate cyclase (GGDEF)-like protein/PAS domain S-box-containing protein
MDPDGAHGTLILDRSGAIRYCSPALGSLSGRRTDELVGKPMDLVLPGYCLAEPVPGATLAPCCGTPPALRLSCADGRNIPVEVTASTLPGELGALWVLEIRAHDAQCAAPPELQQFTWSVEQSSDAVIVTDAHGVIFARSEATGRSPAIVKSGHHGPDFYRTLWAALRAGVEFRGVFINRKRSGELFHAEQVIRPFFGPDGRVTHFVSISRDVTDRVREMESLAHAATHDSLTDLPNRRLFFDRLGQALRQAVRHGTGLAVAVVDIDRFKTINDLHGHVAGDAVLQGVATRLQHCVREADTVARLGGDEFGLILLDAADPAVVAPVLEKILHAFVAPMPIDDHEIPASISIGACLYPTGGSDERELLKFADNAMYRAKQAGGNCYRLVSTRQAADPPERGAP